MIRIRKMQKRKGLAPIVLLIVVILVIVILFLNASSTHKTTEDAILPICGSASPNQSVYIYKNNILREVQTADSKGLWSSSTSYTSGEKIEIAYGSGDAPRTTVIIPQIEVEREYLTDRIVNAPYRHACI